MSNGTEHSHGDSRTDELLTRLIRLAAAQTSSDFAWPPDETVLAYLQGKANEAQHEAIQTAIAQSSAFRRFLIDTADQLSAVTSNEAARDFDAVEVPASLSRKGRGIPRPRPNWLGAILRPRVLAPVVVGAAAVFVMLAIDPMGLFKHQPAMFAAYSELDRSEFVSLSPRGTQPEDSIPTAYATAYDAAIQRLRESIAYDLTSGGYELSEGVPSPIAPAADKAIVLRFLDQQGTEIGKITAPAYASGNLAAEAWIVVPPPLTLWHLSLPADSLDVTWPSARPARGCATFTERTDSGYIATPGHIFQL